MTKTVTCAADLIDHPEFVAICGFWERDLRCPLILPDWLREQGLWKQAEVAEWAVNEPERPNYNSNSDSKNGPSPEKKRSHWRWQVYLTMPPVFASDLLIHCGNLKGITQFEQQRQALSKTFATFVGAVAALLDHYTPTPH